MRAILINPADKSISEVDYNGDFRQISKLIHAESGLFDVVNVAMNETIGTDLYVDDEGLLVDEDVQVYFQWRHLVEDNGFHKLYRFQTLAGAALVLDVDVSTGESQATTVTIEWVREHVRFRPD